MNIRELVAMEADERRMELENEKRAENSPNEQRRGIYREHAQTHREMAESIRRVLAESLER